eukprot:14497-Heterococcus_DN1.PRE.2
MQKEQNVRQSKDFAASDCNCVLRVHEAIRYYLVLCQHSRCMQRTVTIALEQAHKNTCHIAIKQALFTTNVRCAFQQASDTI